MSGGGLSDKNMGELALLGVVGAMTGGAGDAALLGTGGADAAAGAGAAGAAAASTPGQMAVADNALYADAAGAGAGGAGAGGAGATNALGVSQATNPYLYSVTTPSATATGLWGTGAGAGAAGQAGLIGTGLGLGYTAMRADAKKYGIPSVPTPNGPLQNLHGAGGVNYPTNYGGTVRAAGGGLMNANPNIPMAHNVLPTYAASTSTPVPQPVMHFASGGSSSQNSPYDQLTAYLQAQQAAQEQQAAFAQAQQRQPQAQQNSPGVSGPVISVASGGMLPSYATGGISNLGSYSDGGRMLKGPGDGMSDSIPATINQRQPARLANDEFVVPADVVSHLGNGSSDAGAKKLYAMMDRVRRARTGTNKQAKAINPDRYTPT
jgi:hypothetical protein